MKKENEELSQEDLDKVENDTRREFIKKFGKYAVSAPTGVFLLMSLGTSKAHAESDVAGGSSSTGMGGM